jgi:hypothetical protein
MELKTKDFKNILIKDYEREKYTLYISLNLLVTPEEFLLCEIIFENLKWKFVNIPVLAFSDFNKLFIFYVDGNKERGYKVALY